MLSPGGAIATGRSAHAREASKCCEQPPKTRRTRVPCLSHPHAALRRYSCRACTCVCVTSGPSRARWGVPDSPPPNEPHSRWREMLCLRAWLLEVTSRPPIASAVAMAHFGRYGRPLLPARRPPVRSPHTRPCPPTAQPRRTRWSSMRRCAAAVVARRLLAPAPMLTRPPPVPLTRPTPHPCAAHLRGGAQVH